MVWGLLVSSIGAFLMVLSLAEICQAFPLTGGQYDWACKSQLIPGKLTPQTCSRLRVSAPPSPSSLAG